MYHYPAPRGRRATTLNNAPPLFSLLSPCPTFIPLAVDGVKELECTEPSMTYTKFPASYHSKFHSAPSFTSKSCALSKDFGEDSVSVLATFDGTTSPSTAELTAKITSEIKTLLSTLGINAPSASG